MREEDQERIQIEIRGRVKRQVLGPEDYPASKPIDEVLAESIYQERIRLKEEEPSRRRKDDLLFWEQISDSLRRSSDAAWLGALEDVIVHYAREIAGHFDPRVYNAVTRAGAPALGLLLNAFSPKKLVTAPQQLPSIDEAIVMDGELEQLRRLHELGTVILVPTHVSNMDSIVIGYALWKLGLPPFLYGAGLNLFSNPLIGFFMHNLGAYTVDRKKRDPLYKDVLKEYATLTLECGYDNIFFPGGTRARSGAFEQKLKLGLLGSGVRAYTHNLQQNKTHPKVFIVPASLNYQLVLEAETLIDDFLKEVGKSRYIITDDEFSEPRRVFDFMRRILHLDSKIYFTVGKACDPFGNDVDEEGESLDPTGRRIDPSRYVWVRGVPDSDPQRDAEYTREVGERLMGAYARDNVVLSTNISARAIFNLLRRHNPNRGLLRLIRSTCPVEDFSLRDVYLEVEWLLERIREQERIGQIRIARSLSDMSIEDIVADGLRHFASFHTREACVRRGDRVFVVDKPLLLYYQNRLEGYAWLLDHERKVVLSPDHRRLWGLQ